MIAKQDAQKKKLEKQARGQEDVYLDITVAGKILGRIVIQLYDEKVPKTCRNFRELCTQTYRYYKYQGYQRHKGYISSSFDRIIPGFMIQGGKLNWQGTKFADQGFYYSHDRPFLVSMANEGKDTNCSQFFITTAPCKWLDGEHVVFGHVIEGQEIVRKIESQGSPDGTPQRQVKIYDCGKL